MSWKGIIFIVFVFFIGQAMCLLVDGTWIGTEEVSLMNSLTGYTTVEISESGILMLPKVAYGFFTEGLPKLIMWDYSFLQGEAEAFKWFILYPISAGVVYAMAMMVISLLRR